MKTIPNYHPPSDYRRPTKTQEKIYVPVNDYPEINFSILTPLLTICYHTFLEWTGRRLRQPFLTLPASATDKKV